MVPYTIYRCIILDTTYCNAFTSMEIDPNCGYHILLNPNLQMMTPQLVGEKIACT